MFPDVRVLNCISAETFLFHFVRRFWNQIFICVSVSLSDFESSVRREIVKYLLLRNSPSSSFTCEPVNAVRFRFLVGSLLLFRSRTFPSCCVTVDVFLDLLKSGQPCNGYCGHGARAPQRGGYGCTLCRRNSELS